LALGGYGVITAQSIALGLIKRKLLTPTIKLNATQIQNISPNNHLISTAQYHRLTSEDIHCG
jgi:hypothetical protein